MFRSFARAAIAAASIAAAIGAANAHVTLDRPEAAPGSAYQAVLSVPHGCAGSPTTALRVKIPEGFIYVEPMPKAGWTLEIKTGPYEKSYEVAGSTVTEGPVEITWSGGSLPDGEQEEFLIRGTIAGSLAAGTQLFFPMIQVCEAGENAWIDTSGGDSEFPAPSVTLIAPAGGH